MRICFLIPACILGMLLIGGCKKDHTPNYHTDGEVKVLMKNTAKGPNIVFLGDGFTREDLEVGGIYDQKVKELTNYLMATPPFNRYKNKFNVYQVYAESNKRGAVDSVQNVDTRTKFNSYFTPDKRMLLLGNYTVAFNYVEKAIPFDEAHLKVILVNDSRYGGTGGSYAVLSLSEYALNTFVHEVGHTFAFLGDEYIDSAIAVNRPKELAAMYPNLDTTSDLTKIKWKHYFNRPRYNGIVGAFEGGFYRAKGVYRPEERGTMYSNILYRNFNAPGREAIVRRIYEISGMTFNLNNYFKEDAGTMLLDEAAYLPPQTARLLVGDHVKPEEQLKLMEQQRRHQKMQNQVH